jgi:pilus assembly protein FimV
MGNRVQMKSPTRLSPLLGLLLVLASSPVFALGLGQIDVKSRPGEPLLAEIPIVSSDPRELEQLRARLASPDTFRRIGLQPPEGIVSDLQFSVALDARGRPVLRVTSAAPVQQPVLTFLVEVDWGQGRLVREYSALVGAPGSAAAVAQPVIQAPVAPPPSTVVREPIVREPLAAGAAGAGRAPGRGAAIAGPRSPIRSLLLSRLRRAGPPPRARRSRWRRHPCLRRPRLRATGRSRCSRGRP